MKLNVTYEIVGEIGQQEVTISLKAHKRIYLKQLIVPMMLCWTENVVIISMSLK